MIDSARAEKRERTAMRGEDKYTDDTDPVEDPERRMKRQVDEWKEANADELRDEPRDRAAACLQAEKAGGVAGQAPPEEAAADDTDGRPAESGEKVDNRKLVYEDI